jgi:hypothetical protein
VGGELIKIYGKVIKILNARICGKNVENLNELFKDIKLRRKIKKYKNRFES